MRVQKAGENDTQGNKQNVLFYLPLSFSILSGKVNPILPFLLPSSYFARQEDAEERARSCKTESRFHAKKENSQTNENVL